MTSQPDENLDATFERLFAVLRSERFLQRKGLGNEVPFFISAHHAALQPRVDQAVDSLAKRLNNAGISVVNVNLYQVTLDSLKARGLWDRILEREPQTPRDRMFEMLKNLTDPQTDIAPAIGRILSQVPAHILFITGVGLVYPYIRTHRLLESLQTVVKHVPTVIFFPGDYSFEPGKGSHLKLFGVLPDDRYYRAFNIADFRSEGISP